MLRFFAAALLCALFAIPADAKDQHRAAACVETGSVMTPVCGMGVLISSPSNEAAKISTARDGREAARVARGQYIADRLGYGGVRPAEEITLRSSKHKRLSRKRVSEEITPAIVDVMRIGAERIARPSRYIAGRLICAINVNAALAERGIRGTGSALAKSFLGWGRASEPVPGAVAVSSRRGGGHVAIVSRVEGGQVYVWNPSPQGRGWQEVAYRHRAISFRVPG
jgi:hypothetical protein